MHPLFDARRRRAARLAAALAGCAALAAASTHGRPAAAAEAYALIEPAEPPDTAAQARAAPPPPPSATAAAGDAYALVDPAATEPAADPAPAPRRQRGGGGSAAAQAESAPAAAPAAALDAGDAYALAGEAAASPPEPDAAAPAARAARSSTQGTRIAYAAVPSGRDLDVAATGSIAGTLSGFRSQIEAGAIVVRDSAPTRCLPGDLTRVLADVSRRFGQVRIMSTHRTTRHNRRVGGARGSLHLSCRAIDFRVAGGSRAVLSYLRGHPNVGGLKLYRNGIIHIDDGVRRSW